MQNGMYTRGKKTTDNACGVSRQKQRCPPTIQKVTFWRLTVEFQGESVVIFLVKKMGRWLNAGIDFSGVEFDLQIGRCYARVERWQLIV